VEELRRPLHLVQRELPPAAQERLGVASRQLEGIEVVQRHQATPAGHQPLDQGGLARLAGARDDRHRHHAQAARQQARGVPGQHAAHAAVRGPLRARAPHHPGRPRRRRPRALRSSTIYSWRE